MRDFIRFFILPVLLITFNALDSDAWDKDLGRFQDEFHYVKMDSERIFLLRHSRTKGALLVFNRSNGKEIWSYQVGARPAIFQPLENCVIFHDKILNSKTGKVVTNLPQAAQTERYMFSDKYFYYRVKNDLYCVNSKGKLRWKKTIKLPAGSVGVFREAKGGVAFYGERSFYFASNKGKIKRLFRVPKAYSKSFSTSYTLYQYKGKRLIVAVASSRKSKETVAFLVEQGRVKKKLKVNRNIYYGLGWRSYGRSSIFKRGKEDFIGFTFSSEAESGYLAINLSKRSLCPVQLLDKARQSDTPTAFHNGVAYKSRRLLFDIVTGKQFPEFSKSMGLADHWTATKHISVVDSNLIILDPETGETSKTKFEFPTQWAKLTSRCMDTEYTGNWDDSEKVTIYTPPNGLNKAAIGFVDVETKKVHTLAEHKNTKELSKFAQFGDKKGYVVYYVVTSESGSQMRLAYKELP